MIAIVSSVKTLEAMSDAYIRSQIVCRFEAHTYFQKNTDRLWPGWLMCLDHMLTAWPTATNTKVTDRKKISNTSLGAIIAQTTTFLCRIADAMTDVVTVSMRMPQNVAMHKACT